MKTKEKDTMPLAHRIYLIRHGDVDVASQICYGQLDVNVADSFHSDLSRLVNYIQTSLTSDSSESASTPLIMTSPLSRCSLLAKGLKSKLKQLPLAIETELQTNEALKEINFGLWEGKSWDSIGKEEIENWNNELLDYTFPEGESSRDFDCRVIREWNAIIDQLAEKTQSQTVILIAHAGVIRSILSAFLNIPLQHSLSLQIDKMSCSQLRIIPQFASLSRCLNVNTTI